ncbi:MAG: hypothetical protein EHM70_25150 [Chloroflexota bacterium]|nr:MAG: hypothetical protein EHM70_25150 [Chloroflexota bacterium]
MSDANQKSGKYPIGTIVYYGPDDKTVTKLVASVVLSQDADPIMQKWIGEEVTTDREVLSQLGKFFQSHNVQKVVMTDRVAGCPHEEGVDFPVGEECPYCPYWRGKQGIGES